jgi:hypothetical protein
LSGRNGAEWQRCAFGSDHRFEDLVARLVHRFADGA